MKKEFSFFPTQLADGHPISLEELVSLNQRYEVGCTAEYLKENYPELDCEECIGLARQVRSLIDENEIPEWQAIDEVLAEI